VFEDLFEVVVVDLLVVGGRSGIGCHADGSIEGKDDDLGADCRSVVMGRDFGFLFVHDAVFILFAEGDGALDVVMPLHRIIYPFVLLPYGVIAIGDRDDGVECLVNVHVEVGIARVGCLYRKKNVQMQTKFKHH